MFKISSSNLVVSNNLILDAEKSKADYDALLIAGDIADRSLSNYMPHMQGFQMKGTQITGGRISTTATTPDGKKANVDMYSASQFEKPDAPHSVVTASDGSQWYQMASGEGRGAFYDAPVFGGMNAQAAGGVNSDAVNPTPGESAAGTEAPRVHTDASGAPAGENIVPGAEGAPQNVGEFPGDQTHIVPGAPEGMQPEGIIPGGAEVPGVQTDATGAPVSEGIVPGGDAMPQGVATFPGDQMHEVPGTTEGIVPGGGVTYIRAISAIEDLKGDNEDETTGIQIVRRAIEEPLRQIVANAGKEGAVIVQKVREGEGDFGYNARTDVFENLMASGVIDPAKVTRVALENAASIAGMLLTTACIVSDKKEDNPAPAMPPMGGGMGGMM